MLGCLPVLSSPFHCAWWSYRCTTANEHDRTKLAALAETANLANTLQLLQGTRDASTATLVACQELTAVKVTKSMILKALGSCHGCVLQTAPSWLCKPAKLGGFYTRQPCQTMTQQLIMSCSRAVSISRVVLLLLVLLSGTQGCGCHWVAFRRRGLTRNTCELGGRGLCLH